MRICFMGTENHTYHGDLEANETIEIDVKKLRDEQVPDLMGNKLPIDLTKGQVS